MKNLLVAAYICCSCMYVYSSLPEEYKKELVLIKKLESDIIQKHVNVEDVAERNNPTELLRDGLGYLRIAYDFLGKDRETYQYCFERGHAEIRIAAYTKAPINTVLLDQAPLLSNALILQDRATIEALVHAGADLTQEYRGQSVHDIVVQYLSGTNNQDLIALLDEVEAKHKMSKEAVHQIHRAERAVRKTEKIQHQISENNDDQNGKD